jgi:hypothetical protein
MMVFKRGEVPRYKFCFVGSLIRESTKSTSKAVAKDAEKQRRLELEAGFNNITEAREQRIRSLREVVAEYLNDYRLRYSVASLVTDVTRTLMIRPASSSSWVCSKLGMFLIFWRERNKQMIVGWHLTLRGATYER